MNHSKEEDSIISHSYGQLIGAFFLSQSIILIIPIREFIANSRS